MLRRRARAQFSGLFRAFPQLQQQPDVERHDDGVRNYVEDHQRQVDLVHPGVPKVHIDIRQYGLVVGHVRGRNGRVHYKPGDVEHDGKHKHGQDDPPGVAHRPNDLGLERFHHDDEALHGQRHGRVVRADLHDEAHGEEDGRQTQVRRVVDGRQEPRHHGRRGGHQEERVVHYEGNEKDRRRRPDALVR